MTEYTLLKAATNGAPPAAPVPTKTNTGGTVLTGAYGVEVSYVTDNGETVASAAGTVTTTADTSTLTVPSPAARSGATGWYAYVTQADGSTYTRQQTAGSPTAIGTALTLTAPPSSSGAEAPSADGTGDTLDFGAGNVMTRVMAKVVFGEGVTAGDVTINGSADGSTFVPLMTFQNGLEYAAVWFSAASTYRAFSATLASYAGTGAVTVLADFGGGCSASSAGAAVGRF